MFLIIDFFFNTEMESTKFKR
ncbi:hypothetical protein BDFB_013521 [Asbolus verrucosus]|uniref:Uncharacterized protein n=1 Tax=Asbolus verrucosus TaxID=1661398 RepID=A0A482VIW5_ASBVE|nr:hypothetical protein BDFB_013521 [Asbolus verrucosus]